MRAQATASEAASWCLSGTDQLASAALAGDSRREPKATEVDMRIAWGMLTCSLAALVTACSSPATTTDTLGDAPLDVGAEWSDQEAADASADVPTPAFCEGPVTALFDPAAGLALPFPSDLFSVNDPTTPTGVRVAFTAENSSAEPMFTLYKDLRAQLNALDGFGTTAALVFAFSGSLGAPTIGPGATTGTDSPLVLVDVQPGSPGFGAAVPLLVEYLDDVAADGTGQHYLLAEPALPLRPKTRYAAAVTRRLVDADGQCVAPSEATRALVTGREPARFGRLGALVVDALAVLQQGGFVADAGDVAALTVFTTQSIEEEIVEAVKEVRAASAANPPRVIEGSVVATPGSDGVALELRGRFPANRYLGPDGVFVVVNGKPVVQAVDELEFLLTLPEITPERQPPFPLVVHEHGLTGTKEEDMGMKRAQARAGFATIAIDAVMHGSRKLPEGLDVTNFFGIDLKTGSFDMPRTRDNFRQTYLDTVTEAELVVALAASDYLPAGALDGVPEIAAAPVYLTGHSLGATMGGAVTALSPRVAIANLCAGGGGVMNILLRSQLFGTFITALKPEGTSQADIRRFFPVLQTLVERGDPANYARLVSAEPLAALGCTPRHVLFQEVMDDTYVPNHTNELLARALGLSHVRPVLREVFGLPAVDEPLSPDGASGLTLAFFQFDLQNGGTEPAVHTHIFADQVAQTQWIHFFKTYRDAGRPEVVDPYRVLGIPR
jgi:hypothetical protein